MTTNKNQQIKYKFIYILFSYNSNTFIIISLYYYNFINK